jgi:hypothetical protein
MFNLRRTEHISDELTCLHWQQVAERVRFKMAVLVYKSLHGSAPSYFTNIFTPLSITERRALHSSASHQLLVPRCRLSTIGDRAFPVLSAIVWNSLPLLFPPKDILI